MKNSSIIVENKVGSTSHVRIPLMVAVFVAVISLFLNASPTLADEKGTRGVSGTVMSIGPTSFRMAAKSGLKTVFVDADTEIRRGKNGIALSGIAAGDRISVSTEHLPSGVLLAIKIKVRGKSSEKQIQHLTGVVIENGNGVFRLASRNGHSVDIEVEEGVEPPSVADVVTTIVENDLATGRIQAKQIERVEKIVERLEDSLSKQVDAAKAAVLKKIIDENARQHLDTLNQTLDQVEDEAKVKIGAALTRFRTDYAAVAERVGNAAPEESYEGVISGISASGIIVGSPTADGTRTFQTGPETDISIDGIANASTLDLIVGQSVVIRFLPDMEEEDTNAFALAIEVLPPALPPIVADAVEELNDGIVQGEVTVVEPDSTTDTSVIIIDEAVTGDTVGVEITGETVIIIDSQPGTTDDVEPSQAVEVTVAEDGVTAETVIVTTGDPLPTEQSVSGIVSGNDPARRVIVITPAAGNPLRLEVLPTALVTLNGATATLDQIRELDVVLSTSRYLPESATVTRLAVARPAPAAEPEPEGVSATPTPTPAPGTTPAGPAAKQPFSIRGLVKSFSDEFIVLDGMSLPRSAGFTLPEGVSAGSEVDLVFTIGEDGSLILTGIQVP